MREVYLVTGNNCHGCKVQKERLKEAGIEFKELDREKNQDFCSKMGIMGIPVTLVMANGKPVASWNGTVDVKYIKEVLEV